MKRNLFFLICLSLYCVVAFAQKSSVHIIASKNTILIGEPFQITITATFSKPHTALFHFPDTIDHFEIMSRGSIDSGDNGREISAQQTFTLTSWDSGTWQIPSFEITKGLRTKPIIINVSYSPMAPNQPYHDIKDIIDVPVHERTTWYWYAAIALALLVLFALVFPKGKKETKAIQTPPEEAYRQALKDLQAIENNKEADDKMYFTQLIQVFRQYVQQRTGIHSLQQTTGDLAKKMQALDIEHGVLKKLGDTLQTGDMVKFARYEAGTDERHDALQHIRTAIETIEQKQK